MTTSSEQKTTFQTDLSSLNEELELLHRFSKEAAPLKSVSLEARLQLHARFRAEFLAIAGRGEHLEVVMPKALGRSDFEVVVVHLWQSFVHLRELFMTEMVLLPPPMEKVCLSVVLAVECQAATCRIIGRLLYARAPDVEHHVSRLCRRADALASEFREADKKSSANLDAHGQQVKESLMRSRPGGIPTSKRGVSHEAIDPLLTMRQQALKTHAGLKRLFPDKEGYVAPKHDALPAFTGTEAEVIPSFVGEEEFRHVHIVEFDVDAQPGVEGLGFGCQMPPEPAYVVRVEKGSWAEENGIQVDDELIAVSGAPLSAMDAGQLGKLLKRRPVRLTFAREEEEPEDTKVGSSHLHLATRHDKVRGGFPTTAAVATTMSEIGHHEWFDSCSLWFSEVVEASRNLIADRTPETDAFVLFLLPLAGHEMRTDPEDGKARSLKQLKAFYRGTYSTEECDDYWEYCTPLQPGAVGQIVGLASASQRLGYASRQTDIAGSRAMRSLQLQARPYRPRTDKRVAVAIKRGFRMEASSDTAQLKAGDVFRNAILSEGTDWPVYDGDQLTTIASSYRREVQGAFLAL